MKTLLIGLDNTTLQGIKEKVPEGISTQGMYTLEEAEQILASPEAPEIKVIVINETLLSREKPLIAAGEFLERIRATYQETIMVVTSSFNDWRVLKKLGATHWAQQWNIASMLIKIINDKLKPEVTCST